MFALLQGHIQGDGKPPRTPFRHTIVLPPFRLFSLPHSHLTSRVFRNPVNGCPPPFTLSLNQTCCPLSPPPPQRALFDPVVNEIIEISNKQLKLAAEQQGLPSGAHKVWGCHTSDC